MIEIQARQNNKKIQIEINEQKRGLRSIVAEINPYYICPEHGSCEEFTTVIQNAVQEFLTNKQNKL